MQFAASAARIWSRVGAASEHPILGTKASVLRTVCKRRHSNKKNVKFRAFRPEVLIVT